MKTWAGAARELALRTFREYFGHRSAEMGAALAFFGALSLAGLALVATYFAAAFAGRSSARVHAGGQVAHYTGVHNGQFLESVLREASRSPFAWIAAVVGAVIFFGAVYGTALQLERMIDIVWDVDPKSRGSGAASEAERHAGPLGVIFLLSFFLLCLLFAGAALHALFAHTNAMPKLHVLLYQTLDVVVSIALLSCVFLVLFASLSPLDVPWRTAWAGGVLAAVLYERGQFGLAFYLGQIDVRSPYADVGAVVAVLLWLYYSAQVLLVGAYFTKSLKQAADERSAHTANRSRAASRSKRRRRSDRR